MNHYLRTGDGNHYRDGRTGQIYRFDRKQFYHAFHKAVRSAGGRRVILDVFAALWDILALYEISDGYNYRPDTGTQEGAEEYFDTLLKVF